MARPYSVDLRERVVRAVEGGASRRASAAKFEVSISFVVKLMQRWRRCGTVQPERIGGAKRSALAAHAERVRTLVAAEPDLTLAELRHRLADEGIATSRSGLGRFLVAAGLTRKKDPARRRAGPPGRRRRAARLARRPAGPEPGAAGVHRRDLGEHGHGAALRGRAQRGARLVAAVPHGMCGRPLWRKEDLQTGWRVIGCCHVSGL